MRVEKIREGRGADKGRVMKGYKFYAEMPDSWGSKSGCKSHRSFTRATLREWNHCPVAAVFGDVWLDGGNPVYECVASVYFHENSAVGTTAIAVDRLRKRCVRIDEALARRLHPALFEGLDSDD